jgi:hypothetical protein
MMNKIPLISALLFILFRLSYSQVTVAPVTVHLDDHNKNGYILVRNNSNSSPWEVNIEMKFGYPKSDSLGNTFIYFPENVNENDPSAVNWVNFYPRKFIIKPLEEQKIRIAAKPKNLKEGEFWGRPVITSRAVNTEDTLNKENIKVGIGLEFKTVIALNYRRGKVSTGINIENFTGEYKDRKFILFVKLKREGNAAYIGNLILRIFNNKGDKIKQVSQDISVYYDLFKKVEIDYPDLKSGKYTAEVEMNTDRVETGAVIIKGNTLTKKINIDVN